MVLALVCLEMYAVVFIHFFNLNYIYLAKSVKNKFLFTMSAKEQCLVPCLGVERQIFTLLALGFNLSIFGYWPNALTTRLPAAHGFHFKMVLLVPLRQTSSTSPDTVFDRISTQLC